jgi:hypothetical protein
MSFEHISRPLGRAVDHAATLQAAKKIVATFTGELSSLEVDQRAPMVADSAPHILYRSQGRRASRAVMVQA